MSREFKESRLCFQFGKRWRVCKLDDHPYYCSRMKKLEKTRAVDFLGVLDDIELYLIEVKNYRHYRIENKTKLMNLPAIVGRKVRDSLAYIVGAYRNSDEPEQWKPYINLLCHPARKVRVVIWLEEDFPPYYPLLRRKAMASTRTKVFKQKLQWLTTQVLVCGSQKHGLPDLIVSFLPDQAEER